MTAEARPGRTAVGEGVYAAALLRVPGLGPGMLRRLAEAFGSLRQAWEAPAAQWESRAAIPSRIAAAAGRRTQEELATVQAWLSRTGIRAVTVWDRDGYPANLRLTPEPPPVLFVKGSLQGSDRAAVAIVGSRSAAPEGILVAEELAFELAALGFTIVSGLAAGIDAAAHRGALRARGRTLAVLGCGPDRVYPPQHQRLYRQIAAAGAILSEYLPGTGPAPWQFAARNRVIAGLSAAVVVVEARARSGALSTAALAQELSREVLAVPGDVYRATCRGSNALLRDGARVCLAAGDVVDAVSDQLRAWRLDLATVLPRSTGPSGAGAASVTPALSPRALELLGRMGQRPAHIDELSSATGLDVSGLLACLSELEAAGRVRRLADGRFLRRG
mgnify:CR=1 FL=1